MIKNDSYGTYFDNKWFWQDYEFMTERWGKELVMVEEPSYMMFARANVRDNMPSSPVIVRELLACIDRLESEKKVIEESNA